MKTALSNGGGFFYWYFMLKQKEVKKSASTFENITSKKNGPKIISFTVVISKYSV